MHDACIKAVVTLQALARGGIARRGFKHLLAVTCWLFDARNKRAVARVLKDVSPVVTSGCYSKRLPAVHMALTKACRLCAIGHGLAWPAGSLLASV